MNDIELLPYQVRSHRKNGYCSDYPRLYEVWLTMRNRCQNPNREKYKDYGTGGYLMSDVIRRAYIRCA